MEQPRPEANGPEDVLSMGEGRPPRWGLLGALLAVLVLGIGGYQLLSRPSAPAAPEAAAAAPAGSSALSSGSGSSGFREGRSMSGATVQLGGEVVTLSGRGVTEEGRETSATALGRVRDGWLVRLTSKACEGDPDTEVSYGVARRSGRFTAWHAVTRRGATSWRSPDRTLRLVETGPVVEVRRIPSGRVLFDFGSGA